MQRQEKCSTNKINEAVSYTHLDVYKRQFYDNYKGAISFVRIKDGVVRPGMEICFMATGKQYTVTETGIFTPRFQPVDELKAGDVGYIAASIKTVADTRVGDTITGVENPAMEALPGYKKALPVVFCGIYPADGGDYDTLKDALEKLQLNDAALSYEPETSIALGFGFRCGFLAVSYTHLDVYKRQELENTEEK